jgi:hypothetical protein
MLGSKKEVSVRISLVAMACHGERLQQVTELANDLSQCVETHLFMPFASERTEGLAPEVCLHATWPARAIAAWRSRLAMGNPLVHAENAKRIRRVAPDLVHLLQPHPSHALLIPLLGVPSCLSVHDPMPSPSGLQRPGAPTQEDATPWGQTLREVMINRSLGMVDHLLIRDPALLDALLKLGVPRSRLTLIPPHADDASGSTLAAYRQLLARLQTPRGFPAAHV